ncbi:MAG: BamA/TamA family outer membrane protein [Candidatus Eisenbacteria bacterium]|nr:BamA/TamA family outer membrane protein [Candidatus Eisenbacteria bacterium]
MNLRLVRCLVPVLFVPSLAASDAPRRIDAIRITPESILICADGMAFLLDGEKAAALKDREWFVRGDALVLVAEDGEQVLATKTEGASCDDVLEEERERPRFWPVEIERHEDGVFVRLRQVDAREATIEGTFTGWDPDPMRPEEGGWSYHHRMKRGTHRFRIRYRLEGEERWFEEPPSREERTGPTARLYAIEVGDRGVSWSIEEAEERAVKPGFGAAYNRVDGFRLSYAIDFEHGLRHPARLGWSQAYSFAAERWSWEAKGAVPLRLLPGLRLEASGFDRIRVPTAWTVTESENFAAALLIKEDFFDFVWTKGWSARLVLDAGNHSLSGGYAATEDEPIAKNTDWSLFGRGKTFRENLFAEPDGIAGTNRRIEGRYAYDSRNYAKGPSLGWLVDLQGDYAGWELGGNHDYWRGIAEIRRFQKLAPRLHFDFRLLGGAIRGNPPPQELFRIGGIGTLRAHRFKELVGERLFLANIEYRASVWSSLQTVFFADLGDAWRSGERETFDLESDMGIGLQNERGDVRVDFARRIDRGADEDIVVSLRLNRMF